MSSKTAFTRALFATSSSVQSLTVPIVTFPLRFYLQTAGVLATSCNSCPARGFRNNIFAVCICGGRGVAGKRQFTRRGKEFGDSVERKSRKKSTRQDGP